MATLYRKRDKNQPSFKTAISLRPDTVKGINSIREAFHQRWPKASYPSLSMVLDMVIAKNLQRLQDPEELAVEIEFFEKKYAAGTIPYNVEHNSTGEVEPVERKS